MSTTSETLIAPTYFLDTNAVHMAKLYLELAKDKGLPIGAERALVDVEIEKAFGRNNRASGSLKSGWKLVEFLRSQPPDVNIEYAPISTLELITGLLRGQAMLKAAKESIPSRMWNRMDEREVLLRLEEETLGQANNSAHVEDLFSQHGIKLRECNPGSMIEVWALSRRLLDGIYLEAGDALVYASAVLAQADEIISKDDYFRRVVNCIHNPGASGDFELYGQRARAIVLDFLEDLWGQPSSTVKVPIGSNL